MTDPLTQIVDLLRPDLSFAKYVEAAGRWRVDRREDGRAFFVAPLQGAVRLQIEGDEPCLVAEGDFALIPAAFRYAAWDAASPGPSEPALLPVERRPGVFRLGDGEGRADVRMLVGYCVFASPGAQLLDRHLGKPAEPGHAARDQQRRQQRYDEGGIGRSEHAIADEHPNVGPPLLLTTTALRSEEL